MKAQCWKIAQTAETQARAAELASAQGISALAGQVLAARGFDAQTAGALLQSDPLSELGDPMLLADIIPALEAIGEAMQREALICIYGDYDCDGVTATAIMKSYFDSVGARSCYYIPHREKEGYGLNRAALEQLRQVGVELIITVDNGVTAVDEVAYANTLGMQVVVTDHHTPGEQLPDAVAVIDPHRADCAYPYSDLSGAGVAFKLLCALEGECGEALLEQFADLLALGTVADVVPLTGENRCFVKYGLSLLQESHRPGLRALLALAGGDQKAPDAHALAFGLAPRINAAGRLDTADLAAMLLLTESEQEAAELAQQLETLNLQRRAEEQTVVRDIAAQLQSDPTLAYRRMLVFVGEGWNAGIVGIVCSRMVERFGKPCVLIAIDGDEAKGSGRSVEGFSLIEAVRGCAAPLTRYGGHPMAAGFSLKSENAATFCDLLQQYCAAHDPDMPGDSLHIDCEVSPALLTVEQIDGLDALAPFGAANPEPVFLLRQATLENIIALSQGKHCRLQLRCAGEAVSLLCFSQPPATLPVEVGDVLDVAFAASVREYQGQRSATLVMKGLRLHAVDNALLWQGNLRYERYLRGELREAALLPTREETARIYRILRGKGSTAFSPQALYCHIAASEPLDYTRFRIALAVMLERGLLIESQREGRTILSVNAAAPKVRLEDSPIMKELLQTV